MLNANRKIITFALFLVTFMSAIEGTIVITAMPIIISDLQGVEVMNWVLSIYLLATAVTAPIYGKLADRFSRKFAFNIGLFFFLGGSLLSGISPNMLFLIIARAIQGIGGGAIMPLTLILLADLFDVDKRTKMLGVSSAIWGIAGLLGPLTGGIIVQNISWHWIFLINLPVGIFAMWMITTGLEEKAKLRDTKPLDISGTIFLVLIILSFMLSVQFFGSHGFSLLPIFFLVICILSTVIFKRIERKAADPIVPFYLLKNKNFMVYSAIGFIMNGFLIALDFYIPMWVQVINGESPTLGGIVITPQSFMWMVGAFITQGIVAFFGLRHTLIIGSVISTIFAVVIVFLPQNPTVLRFITIGIFLGLAFGVVFTAFTIGVQQSVAKKDVGIATGLNSLVRVGGNTVMIAVYGAILNIFMKAEMVKGANIKMMNVLMKSNQISELPKNLILPMRTLLYHGLRAVFVTALILMIINTLILLIFKTPQGFEENFD